MESMSVLSDHAHWGLSDCLRQPLALPTGQIQIGSSGDTPGEEKAQNAGRAIRGKEEG